MTVTFLTDRQANGYRYHVHNRCHCKASCLSPIFPSDATVPTPDGPALAVHLRPVRAYPVAGLTSLVSPLSKVRVK